MKSVKLGRLNKILHGLFNLGAKNHFPRRILGKEDCLFVVQKGKKTSCTTCTTCTSSLPPLEQQQQGALPFFSFLSPPSFSLSLSLLSPLSSPNSLSLSLCASLWSQWQKTLCRIERSRSQATAVSVGAPTFRKTKDWQLPKFP